RVQHRDIHIAARPGGAPGLAAEQVYGHHRPLVAVEPLSNCLLDRVRHEVEYTARRGPVTAATSWPGRSTHPRLDKHPGGSARLLCSSGKASPSLARASLASSDDRSPG